MVEKKKITQELENKLCDLKTDQSLSVVIIADSFSAYNTLKSYLINKNIPYDEIQKLYIVNAKLTKDQIYELGAKDYIKTIIEEHMYKIA